MRSVEDARDDILGRVRAVSEEVVATPLADGRVLAADAIAKAPLPPFDNSAMDGFAVRSIDLPGSMPISGTIGAGHSPETSLAPGTTTRVMTGAPIPAGADTVVMREEVEVDGDMARFSGAAEAGAHIRKQGEDVKPGQVVLQRGRDLRGGELGMLAALGLDSVSVARRPRVAILATGDELVALGTEPKPGQRVASSSYALAAQIREAGADPTLLGIAGDNREALETTVSEALQYDALVTTGGVSAGDFDYVREAQEAAGVEPVFWKVAMKPGKPLAFGAARTGCLVFGLPGNPVSTWVTFELFVRPALRLMQGATRVDRPRAWAFLTEEYAKRPGRAHYARAQLDYRKDGVFATPHSAQGSGALQSLLDLEALIEIPADSATVPAGQAVRALLVRCT